MDYRQIGLVNAFGSIVYVKVETIIFYIVFGAVILVMLKLLLRLLCTIVAFSSVGIRALWRRMQGKPPFD